MEYYHLPLKLDKILKGQTVAEEVDIRKSIHQNINLILKTYALSYRFDPNFGFVLNKYHASTPPQKVKEREWREKLREKAQNNLKDIISRYETRIKISSLILEFKNINQKKRGSFVKVDVKLSGQLTAGRKEYFHFPDSEVEEDAQDIFPLLIPAGKG